MRFHYVPGVACGLVLIGSLSAQTTQPQVKPVQTQPAQTNVYPPALYRMNDVSKTLNLNQEQIDRLNKLTEQTQAKYSDDYNKITGLNDAGRIARARQLNQQYHNDWSKGAQEILNDSQWNRYQQLHHQHGGFNSFYNSEVQKRLNMTPAQMKNVQDYVEWDNQQVQAIRKLGATDSTKASQLYNQYWTERQNRINTLLTPAQMQGWREITGQPYTFQPAFMQPR